MKSFLPPLILASSLPSPSTALTWNIDATSATCTGSPFTNTDSISITCNDNDSSSCTLGDTAIISGNITATSSFDDTAYVVLQPCIIVQDYEYCPDKYAYSAGGLCNEWITPNDEWDTCGDAAEYSVDYSVTIPNKLPEYFTWLGYASALVTVKVEILTEEECAVDVYASNSSYYDGSNNGYQMVYSMLGFTAGLVCAGAYVRKRRNKEAEEQESRQVKENVGGDYIEMLSGTVSSDASVAVV